MKNKFLIFYFLYFILITFGFSQTVSKNLTEKEINILIKETGQALGKYYVFPEKATAMSDYLISQYKHGAYRNLKSIEQLTIQLQKDLQKICPDPHLHILYNPEMSRKLEKSSKNNKDKEVLASKPFPKINFDLVFTKLELLPSNMVYIRLDEFSNFVNESKPALNATFHWLKICSIVIIDLRYNSGGNPEMVSQLESYFFKDKTRMNDIIDRVQNKTIEMYADPKMADSINIEMPVFILTSDNTFSAAEDFSYGMQTSGRAIIVGETTGGGAHPTEIFSVGQGFICHIPYARSYNNITKTDWEGTGVVPNVPVSSEEALVKAQRLGYDYLLKNAINDKEKMLLQWQLNTLGSGIKNTMQTLKQYIGNYGGLDFFIKDGDIYCKNAERGNKIFKLKQVSDTIFVLDEGVQVQFEKNNEGVYSKLKMLWKDGEITEKSKLL